MTAAMHVALDTDVILDVLMPDKANVLRSRRAIELALEFGTVVISPVVRVELAVMFGDETGLDLFLADTCIKVVPADSRDLALAGRLWRSYAGRRPRRVGCRRCGESVEMGCARCGSPLGTRPFALTDFLVLSHAARHADWLLARAGGAYRWASGLRSVGLRDLGLWDPRESVVPPWMPADHPFRRSLEDAVFARRAARLARLWDEIAARQPGCVDRGGDRR